MPLTNFGAVLGFAETLEREDAAFYESWAACGGGERASRLAAEAGKSAKLLARVRRENVTEMILEPIEGLTRGGYATLPCDPSAAGGEDILAAARGLEARARDFYTEAHQRLSALPEVAGILKRLARKRAERLSALADSAD